jgi:hypothetical protein
MTAAEVRAIVDGELRGRTAINGVDLSRCLVVPRLVFCDEPLPDPNKKRLRLWIVFATNPETHEGDLVVFDEQKRLFGLALWDGEDPVFVGYLGSFLDALAEV